MDSMIKGYAAQLVLTHFDVALLGVIVAYAVVYVFAGPHRPVRRLPQLVMALTLAYGVSRLARVGVRVTTALLQRCVGDDDDDDGTAAKRRDGRKATTTTSAVAAHGGSKGNTSSRSGTTTATKASAPVAAGPAVDATATD